MVMFFSAAAAKISSVTRAYASGWRIRPVPLLPRLTSSDTDDSDSSGESEMLRFPFHADAGRLTRDAQPLNGAGLLSYKYSGPIMVCNLGQKLKVSVCAIKNEAQATSRLAHL